MSLHVSFEGLTDLVSTYNFLKQFGVCVDYDNDQEMKMNKRIIIGQVKAKHSVYYEKKNHDNDCFVMEMKKAYPAKCLSQEGKVFRMVCLGDIISKILHVKVGAFLAFLNPKMITTFDTTEPSFTVGPDPVVVWEIPNAKYNLLGNQSLSQDLNLNENSNDIQRDPDENIVESNSSGEENVCVAGPSKKAQSTPISKISSALNQRNEFLKKKRLITCVKKFQITEEQSSAKLARANQIEDDSCIASSSRVVCASQDCALDNHTLGQPYQDRNNQCARNPNNNGRVACASHNCAYEHHSLREPHQYSNCLQIRNSHCPHSFLNCSNHNHNNTCCSYFRHVSCNEFRKVCCNHSTTSTHPIECLNHSSNCFRSTRINHCSSGLTVKCNCCTESQRCFNACNHSGHMGNALHPGSGNQCWRNDNGFDLVARNNCIAEVPHLPPDMGINAGSLSTPIPAISYNLSKHDHCVSTSNEVVNSNNVVEEDETILSNRTTSSPNKNLVNKRRTPQKDKKLDNPPKVVKQKRKLFYVDPEASDAFVMNEKTKNKSKYGPNPSTSNGNKKIKAINCTEEETGKTNVKSSNREKNITSIEQTNNLRLSFDESDFDSESDNAAFAFSKKRSPIKKRKDLKNIKANRKIQNSSLGNTSSSSDGGKASEVGPEFPNKKNSSKEKVGAKSSSAEYSFGSDVELLTPEMSPQVTNKRTKPETRSNESPPPVDAQIGTEDTHNRSVKLPNSTSSHCPNSLTEDSNILSAKLLSSPLTESQDNVTGVTAEKSANKYFNIFNKQLIQTRSDKTNNDNNPCKTVEGMQEEQSQLSTITSSQPYYDTVDWSISKSAPNESVEDLLKTLLDPPAQENNQQAQNPDNQTCEIEEERETVTTSQETMEEMLKTLSEKSAKSLEQLFSFEKADVVGCKISMLTKTTGKEIVIRGVLVDSSPELNCENPWAIVKGICSSGCKKSFVIGNIIDQSKKLRRSKCMHCKLVTHWLCPFCWEKKGFKNFLCVTFSFEIHVLYGMNVIKVLVTGKNAEKFLGCSLSNYISLPKPVVKVVTMLNKVKVTTPPEDWSNVTMLQLKLKSFQNNYPKLFSTYFGDNLIRKGNFIKETKL